MKRRAADEQFRALFSRAKKTILLQGWKGSKYTAGGQQKKKEDRGCGGRRLAKTGQKKEKRSMRKTLGNVRDQQWKEPKEKRVKGECSKPTNHFGPEEKGENVSNIIGFLEEKPVLTQGRRENGVVGRRKYKSEFYSAPAAGILSSSTYWGLMDQGSKETKR